jgi:hypothetical protein
LVTETRAVPYVVSSVQGDSLPVAVSQRYWVCLYTRDGAATLDSALRSIADQTLPPKFIVVVDDGSTDETPAIVQRYETVSVVRTESRTRDIRRAPRLINMAHERAQLLGIQEYCMITGDDCIFPSNYVETILKVMDSNPTLVVASGDWGLEPPPDMVKAPQGAGRVVRESFMNLIGGRYPERYGWESWILYKALQMNYQIQNLTELRFVHARSYARKQTFNWGRGMWTLGYDPLFVFARIAKNLLFAHEPLGISANLAMLAGYLSGFLQSDSYSMPFDGDLRRFVATSQRSRLMRFLGAPLRKRQGGG